jgi:hypothetical protein
MFWAWSAGKARADRARLAWANSASIGRTQPPKISFAPRREPAGWDNAVQTSWTWNFCVLGFCCLLGLPALDGTAAARQLSSQVTELDEIPRIRPEFKVPDDPDMLFYVERSPNANTVVYAVRRDTHGEVDAQTPVEGFWRWFNVDGQKKSLNFVERMMAYGVRISRPAFGKPVTFQIAALPERTLTLDLDDKKRPEALIQIGNRTATLVYVYLNVIEGGVLPRVPSLDIFAIDKSSGKALHEQIVQN